MPHSGFEDLIRDRTVYRVLAHAKCPVLILRHPLAARTEMGEMAVHLDRSSREQTKEGKISSGSEMF